MCHIVSIDPPSTPASLDPSQVNLDLLSSLLGPSDPPSNPLPPLQSHFDGRESMGGCQWGNSEGVLLVITRLEIDPNRSNRQNFLTQKLEVALLPDPTRTQKFGA